MNEKETFGVELELITSKFSKKMESIKSTISSFADSTKQKLQIGMNMDKTKAEQDLNQMKTTFNKMFNDLSMFSKPINIEFTDNGDLKVAESDAKRVEQAFNSMSNNSKKDLDNLWNSIKAISLDIKTLDTSRISKIGKVFKIIKTPIDKVKNSLEQNKKSVPNFQTAVDKSFNKGISSIKRFALSLFGIQSIWRAVSRASSAYLSQDIELSNKLQAVWVGLGSLLSPILNNLANFFLKMVGYLNVFIKSLTGVDLLAKAMDKANQNTKKASKSTKELKGQLSGIDEITNINDDTGSTSMSGTPDTSWIDAFKGLELDTSWTEAITNFGTWIKDNWEIVAVGITGITLVLGALNLASTLAGIGLTGMLVPLLAIALGVTGLISLVMGIIELFKEGGNETKAWTLILGGLVAIVLAVGLAFGGIPMAIAAVVAAVTAGVLWIIKHWDMVKSAIASGIEFIKNLFVTGFNFIKDIILGIPSFLREKLGVVGDIIAQPFEIGINLIKNIWNGAKQFFSGIKDFFTGIFTLDGNKIKGGLRSMLSGMGNIIIGFIEGVINAFLVPINSAIKLINKIPGVDIPLLKVTIPKIPSFDVGTNYVPNDQLAYVHKGEAIVPKKFNSSEFFDKGNDETNELLRELIDVIEDKDMNLYADGDKIGEIARKYNSKYERIMGRRTA